ncbi:MAG: hypothetical protein ACR2QJ_15310, partial [Geminicoccaceae bacterium]
MNTPLLAVTVSAAVILAGCSGVRNPFRDRAEIASLPDGARHIEIEVGDLETGLPCSVIDRRGADSEDVLWQARFEANFCQQKAEETRLILQRRGWACRPQGADELQNSARRPRGDTSHLVAAWRCVEGLAPIERSTNVAPPVPSTRPAPPASKSASWGDPPLREAVMRDLATIGQEVIDEDTTVEAALGDLDSDGIDDAVVALTRKADRGVSHRLLMAYLQNGEAYNLV